VRDGEEAVSVTVEFEDGKVVIKDVTRIELSKHEVLAVRLPSNITAATYRDASEALHEFFKPNRVICYQGEREFKAISQEEADDLELQKSEQEWRSHVAVVTHIGTGSFAFGRQVGLRVEYMDRVEILEVTYATLLSYSGIAAAVRASIAERWGVESDSFEMEFRDQNGIPDPLPRF
jgi:hypothetical protein